MNAVQLTKQTTERCTITSTKLNAVQLPKTTERCTITETNYWTLYNYLKNYWTLYNYLNKLLNAVQLPKQTTTEPKQTTKRSTIT